MRLCFKFSFKCAVLRVAWREKTKVSSLCDSSCMYGIQKNCSEWRKWKVYRSVYILRNLSCPEKFLVARLCHYKTPMKVIWKILRFSFHYNTKSWMKDLTKIQINVLQNRWGIILTICTKHYFVSKCPSALKHIFSKPSPTLLLSLEIPFFP